MDKEKKMGKDPLILGMVAGSILMFVYLKYIETLAPQYLILSQDHVESIFKLLFAAFAGSVIGLERESKNRPAGLRTHSLVCMGAAVVMIIPTELIASGKVAATFDMTRLGAQVISGIGFLGAGTIIRNEGNVKGLTTAASLWVVAIIGLAIGSGGYITSIAATAIAMFMLKTFGTFEHRNMMKKKGIEIIITTIDSPRQIWSINQVIEKFHLHLRKMEVIIDEEDSMGQNEIIFIHLIAVSSIEMNFEAFFDELKKIDQIIDVEKVDGKCRKTLFEKFKVG